MATIFLDYDGTLHDTMKVYGPAFRAGYAWLVQQGHAQPQEFSDEWISRWLGWTIRDMWTTFMPSLPEDVWRQAAHLIGQEMTRLTLEGEGGLFEGTPEALDLLKERGHTLVLLSNCNNKYRDTHRGIYGLDAWLSDYHTAEDFPGLAKWEIYQKVKDLPGHPYPHIVVGDRFHDIEAATRAGIPSIGCAFGYGDAAELEAATALAASPHDLPALVEQLV